MKQMQLSLEEISTSILFIGFEGEQNHTQVTFYWSSIYSKYPNAVAALTIKPPVGDPYPKAITQTGNKVVWIVSASDVANSGSGEYQLTFTDDGEIIKTYIGKFNVYNSIVGNGEAPTPVEDWIEHANEALNGLGQKVTEAADAWLEENISNPDSPPLDRSLSSSAAAAPADLVGDLKRIEKAPAITDTVENADIATFTDGADGMYLHNLVVGIDPVQDLNGQANPYPGGAGVNLADFVQDKGINASGEVVEHTGRVATVNPITIENGVSYVFKYFKGTGVKGIMSVFSGETLVRRVANILNDATLDTSDGDRFYFCAYLDTETTIDAIEPMIVKSTDTVTKYSPYANICPITGRTGCNVVKTGANIWDEQWLNGYYQTTTGAYVSSANYICSKNKIPVKPSTTYYIKTSNVLFEIYEYDASGNFLRQLRSGIVDSTFTTDSDTYFINIGSHTTMTTYENNVSVIYPSTDTDYHAYAGQTYPISWQTEAGTVYGGTVDVATGVLVFDHALDVKTGDDVTAVGQASSGVWYADFTNLANTSISTTAQNKHNLKSNMYASGYSSSVDCSVRIIENKSPTCYNNALDTQAKAEAFYNANPLQIWYPLATPVEVQLNPVAVATLLGVNNIYADTGAIQSVTYPADTKLYIDKRLAALGGN